MRRASSHPFFQYVSASWKPAVNTSSFWQVDDSAKIASCFRSGVECICTITSRGTACLMYCSSCGSANGDFAVRCHACGQLLASSTSPLPTNQSSSSSLPNPWLAGTAIVATLCLIGLSTLITQRGLWTALLSTQPAPTVVAPESSRLALRQRAVPMPTTSVAPRPVHPMILDLGQVEIGRASCRER